MWIGGVRVIVMDDKNRMLMVCQHHEDRDIWMVPGGGIEEGDHDAPREGEGTIPGGLSDHCL